MRTIFTKEIRKTVLHIVSAMFAAVSIIVVLVTVSPPIIEKSNRFTRRFPFSIIVLHALQVKQRVRSICSAQEDKIYVNTEQPNVLLKTNDRLQQIDTIHLNFQSNDTIASLFDTHIDSACVYIAAGNVPSIILFNTDSNIAHYYHFPNSTFTASALIPKNTFVFRMYKKNENEWDQIFSKRNLVNGNIIEEKNISERNGDAGFSTDGLLYYDKVSNVIIYIFHYRSAFICMDTGLNLKYKARTIDTTGFINVKAISVSSEKGSLITNTTPLRDINLLSCVNNGRLFNVSKCKADNESMSKFENNSVVDVYRVIDGSYEESFYIPFYKGERMQDFKVSGGHIIVLYGTYIVIYKFPGLL